jgi:hypothetical protein
VSTRPTIVALAVAFLSVLAAMLVARQEQGGAGDVGGLGLLVPDLPVEGVIRVTLERRDEVRLVFERVSGAWRQVEPFAHPMDGYSIRQFAVLAAEVVPVKRVEPDQVAGDLGFDPPRATVAYEWQGGTVTLELGRRGVAGRWYVRHLGEDEIAVATGRLYERVVEIDPREWRDRGLFRHASIDADEVEIVEGDRRTRLVRDRRQWRMVEPVNTRIDDLARDALFATIGRAQAAGFILDNPPDLGAFGLEPPAGSFAVTTTQRVEAGGEISEKTVIERLLVGGTLGVGAQDRFGLIEGQPVVVRLPEEVLRVLFGPPTGLIDPTGTGVQVADITGILIRGPEGTVHLERDLEQWSIAGSSGTVEPEPVARLLEILAVTRADEIEIRPYPRELEIATVMLSGPGGRPLDSVRIVREPDTGRVALENGDGVLRIFASGAHIPLTPADFGL